MASLSFYQYFSCGKQFPNDPRHTQGLELIFFLSTIILSFCLPLFNKKNSNSILGGRKAFDPWVVSLGRHEKDDFQHECTGAILTKRIVITAGHCLENRLDKIKFDGASIKFKDKLYFILRQLQFSLYLNYCYN